MTYIDYLSNELGFIYKHIVKVDIAIDCINHNLIQFIDKWQNSKYIRCKGRKKQLSTTQLNENKTYYMGSNKADKQIRIYNKSKELELSHKDYIKDFYYLNGLDYLLNTVERLELSLKGDLVRNIDLYSLNNPDYLASVIQTEFKNYFEFESNYLRNGKRVKKDINLISLEGFKTELLPKYNHTPTRSLRPFKMEIKRLYINHLNELEIGINNNGYNAASMTFYLPLKRICTLHNLTQWYNSKKDEWEKEFNRKQSIYK